MTLRHVGAVLLPLVLLVATPSHVTAQAAAAGAVHFTADDLMASVQTLAAADMQGRQTGTPGNAKAREWISSRFNEAGLAPVAGRSDFAWPFTFARPVMGGQGQGVKVEGVNLVGLCRGTGAADNGALVISAHYDHLGVQGNVTYHGADDNASGVAVLLALARQCRQAPWAHDAIFVAFDAEEMGLQGARAFISALPLPKDRTLAVNVNLDMVARGDTGELYIAGVSHRPMLKPILEPVASRSRVKVRFGHDSGGGREDWTTQSDHGVFHENHIPFVYFGVEDHPDYHKPTDTADKINPAFFFQAALTILDAVTALDRALPLPAK